MKEPPIPIDEHELAWLIRNVPTGTPVDCAFGIGWIALKVTDENEAAIEALARKRGVLSENMDGAAI